MERITINKNLAITILAILFVIITALALVCASYNNEEPAIIPDNNEINILVINNVEIHNNVNEENLNENVEEVQGRSMIMPQEINADFNILQPCGYTQEQLERSMQGIYYNRMIPYIDTIMEAEEKYDVNALYLLCTLGLESGWGKYRAATNNIGGWRTMHGPYRNFESVEDCIMYIAACLSTVYKEEVGTRLEDVCERYCSDDGYFEMLTQIMTECEQRITN